MRIHRKEVFVFSCAFWFQVALSIFTSSAPERSRGSRDKIRSTSCRIITMHPVYSTFLIPQPSTFNFPHPFGWDGALPPWAPSHHRSRVPRGRCPVGQGGSPPSASSGLVGFQGMPKRPMSSLSTIIMWLHLLFKQMSQTAK